MPNPRQRTVLITGCSAGGIGHALAKEYHQAGLYVIATARNLDSMEELKRLGMTIISLDVTNVEDIRKLRDDVATITSGKLDILMNNAGVAYPVAATDIVLSDVRALFEVNVFAPMAMVQEFVHLLIASGDGRIANTGSVSGIMPVPFSVAYNASKAALHSFCNTIRVELAPFNIKVINVITGAVKSNIVKPNTIPAGSLYKPMEETYQERRINRSQMNAMPTDFYAKIVVTEVLKPKPRAWLWTGNQAFLVWFMDTFLGRRGFDWLMTKMFGFSEFSSMVKGGKVKVV
ncbi:NADPH-dependent 1-acyldihydroxyacetone phosphate reductase [Leucoagaricus sp. SymC.cos]|nr:NADPH-dependent 1-acyldihydroxyacetone phosphate reductase [Leucoagaricus sp. SymC.cos]